MRIATYNVEWFSGLFDARGRMLEDQEWSTRYNVTRADQLGSLGIVFTAVDADAVMVIEAPENSQKRQTVPMLEAFAARFDLRCRKAILGFDNETQQEIAMLYDPDALTVEHDPKGGGPGEALRVLPQGAEERDLYAIDPEGDGRGLSRALCPGADEVWLAMGRVRAPRPLTMQAVGRWSDGTFRHCVTLQYDWRGEWQTAPAGPAPRAD